MAATTPAPPRAARPRNRGPWRPNPQKARGAEPAAFGAEALTGEAPKEGEGAPEPRGGAELPETPGDAGGLRAFRIPPPRPASPGASAPRPGDGRLLADRASAVARRLEAAKRELDPYEGDPLRIRAFQLLDPLAPLRGRVGREAGGQAVTNAWLKMYELAEHFDFPGRLLGPGGAGTLRVFFNAELPGAFVSAVNHHLAVRRPGARLEWAASSLWPGGGEGLGDDYGVYAGAPDRWLMGPSLRGDVTDATELAALVAAARGRLGGAADLYTSDVGIGLVGGEYAHCEELLARAHLGQILAGLASLRAGGALVAKTYTFLEPYSVALLGECAALFEEFQVVKPRASRPRNSEVYLVGLGYRGGSPPGRAEPREPLARWWEALAGFDFARPLRDVRAPAMRETWETAVRAAEALHGEQQVGHLRASFELFRAHRGPGGLSALRKKAARAASQARAAWLAANPVPPLPAERGLTTSRPRASFAAAA